MRACWPTERTLLLAEAGLAEPGRAKASWASWVAQTDLDDTAWFEVRALASAADRIAEIDPDYPHMGRLKGFRRFIFINGQRIFAVVRPMLVALREAGIDIMLLKGTARIAADQGAAAARFVGDVDVLVRLEDAPRAWQVAREQGWNMCKKLGPMTGRTWEGQAEGSHALDFAPPPETRRTLLDLHHFSRSLCRNVGDDDGMWAHAQPQSFLGIDVLVPSPTDQLRHTLTHALMHSKRGRPVDWVFDAAGLMGTGEIDWHRLVADTLSSSTQGFVGAALLLLRERIGLYVPDHAIARLVRAFVAPFEGEFVFRTSAFYGDLTRPELNDAALAAVAKRADKAASRLRRTRLEDAFGILAPRPRVSWFKRRDDSVRKVLRGGKEIAFMVPPDLRMGDVLELRLGFKRPTQPIGQMIVAIPQLSVAVWPAGPIEVDLKRVMRKARIPATLLIMTRRTRAGLTLKGDVPIEDLTVDWVRVRPRREAARAAAQRALNWLRAGSHRPSS